MEMRSLRAAASLAAGASAMLLASALAAAPDAMPKVAPSAIDVIFSPWDKANSPGAALAVIHDGAIVYERGYGRAHLERNAAITPDTVFYVGSVSKQFAAATMALLAQDGVLSLDDVVRKHVPELPDYGATITIRHLIHHTSGLRDYLALRAIAGEPVAGTFGDADVLALICRQKALNFAPGTDYLYSNSGYFLLSQIVKRTTGKTLRTVAHERIFQPLGMRTALFRDDHTLPIKNRANGYAPSGSGHEVSNPNFDVVGAGGVFMTVRDFLAWDRNFYDAKVGGRGFVSQLQTPGKLSDGTPLTYAFGLTIGNYRGLRVVEHSGSYGGFRAHVLRFPDQRFSIVCFTNLSTMAPGDLTRKVATLYLGGKMAATATDTLAKKSTKARAQNAGSPAASADRTAASAKNAAGPARLDSLAGEYVSEELQIRCRITVENGALTIHRDRRPPLTLSPHGSDDDTFTGSPWEVAFQRDGTGKATSFKVDSGRVRGLIFTRN